MYRGKLYGCMEINCCETSFFWRSRRTAAFCVRTLSYLGLVWPYTRRLGARKSVQGNHPLDGSPSLFAHLSRGTLRVPFLRGLRARNAGRPLLSLRDISPAPRGNLPAPPPPLKRRAKLLCFSHFWLLLLLAIGTPIFHKSLLLRANLLEITYISRGALAKRL